MNARQGAHGSDTAGTETRPLSCTVVIDVRGLSGFQRDMSSFVYDEGGTQLWPDPLLVKGVDSGLVQRGEMHTYITSEAEVGKFKNVTRVKASRVQANRLAPNSGVLTDSTLDPAAAAAFRSAGKACQVVYLKD